MTFVPERWDVGLWDECHWDGQLGQEAAAGSIALTPKTVTLRVARKASPVKGTIVLAGRSAGLRSARRLTATTRTIVLTPRTANLRVARKLTATTGTILFSGKTAGLARTKLLSVLKGTVTLLGVTANLTVRRNYIVTAVKTSIVLAGQQADLSTGLQAEAIVLQAGTGSVLLSGRSANLFRTRAFLLGIEPGSIVLSCSPALLVAAEGPGAFLVASCGTVWLQGRDATFRFKLSFEPPPFYEPVSFASLQNRTVHLGIHGYKRLK